MAISVVDAAHLLRRTGFGPTISEIDRLRTSRDRSAAVARVLDLSGTKAASVPVVSDADGLFGPWWTVTTWWLERMRTTKVPIVEKMTLFWHDHFVSSAAKVFSMELLVQQHGVLRSHALGDFHAMTQAVALDPAMLVYLDNWLNFSNGAQENFARELMELFTLGVGNYDESDVGELARAWTGYSLSSTFRSHQFHESLHDAGDKSLFGLPPRAWKGPETITEILHGSKAVPASEFIVAKIFSALAYPVTAADAPVPDLAAEFRSSGLDLMALVRSILESDAFWSDAARHAVTRSPIEWMVAGLRALGLTVADNILPSDLVRCGQVPFSHPEVDGWCTGDHWISPGGGWNRAAWATRVRMASFFSGAFTGVEEGTPAEIADAGFERFGLVDPSDHTRAVIEGWAATSQADGDLSTIPVNLPVLVMLSPDFQTS